MAVTFGCALEPHILRRPTYTPVSLSYAYRCFVKLMRLYLPDRASLKPCSRTGHVSVTQPLGSIPLIDLGQILRFHPCKGSNARMGQLPNPPWQVRKIVLIVSTPCPHVLPGGLGSLHSNEVEVSRAWQGFPMSMSRFFGMSRPPRSISGLGLGWKSIRPAEFIYIFPS